MCTVLSNLQTHLIELPQPSCEASLMSTDVQWPQRLGLVPKFTQAVIGSLGRCGLQASLFPPSQQSFWGE